MSREIIPLSGQPEGSNSNTNAGADSSRSDSRASHKRRRRKGRILSREECLAMLSVMPDLVTLKYISTAQANTNRAILRTILQECHGPQPTTATATANDDLLRTLREQPELLEMIEPLLSDDTFDMLMKGFKEDDEPGN
jgi:hypothetical protein